MYVLEINKQKSYWNYWLREQMFFSLGFAPPHYGGGEIFAALNPSPKITFLADFQPKLLFSRFSQKKQSF